MNILRRLQMVVLLLSVSAVFAQKKPPHISGGKYQHDLTIDGLKGAVKSITSYSFGSEEDSGVSSKSWDYRMINEYNKKGNTTRFSYFRNSATKPITHLSIFKYDGHSRVKRVVNESGQVLRSFDYAYDVKHNLVEAIPLRRGILYHLVYNRMGKKDTLYRYNINGQVVSKEVFQYDANGNLIESIRRDPKGDITNKSFYQYDDQHNKTEEIIIDERRNRKSLATFKYDNYGNLISRLDSNSMIIGGDPGKKVGDQLYLRTYTYPKFDQTGNWLQKNVMVDSAVIRTEVRAIEYY